MQNNTAVKVLLQNLLSHLYSNSKRCFLDGKIILHLFLPAGVGLLKLEIGIGLRLVMLVENRWRYVIIISIYYSVYIHYSTVKKINVLIPAIRTSLFVTNH